MRIVKFTPLSSAGAALAFLDVETPSGLIIRDSKLMRGQNGDHWLAMPSQKRLDRDGNSVVGQNGKALYQEFVGFRDRAIRDRFTAAVLAAVRREHPEALQ
jgi:DNA-binding cell septation regulator SpoVG